MFIYLDHAATTPIHPEVRKAMFPFLDQYFGNPSSIHRFGREVRHAIDKARIQVAQALNGEPSQLIFTSGGTEADNLALFGVVESMRAQGKNHIITTQIEHHAILDACSYLEKIGYDVTYLPVDNTGLVNVEDVQKAIRPQTALISVMYGNNEVGTIQPIDEIGLLAKEKGVLFHTDAVQAFGMEAIDVQTLPVDLLSISSHKINGPKGVGALYISKKVKLIPRMFGGSQERRRRAGTENVPGIVGFGQAAEWTAAHREAYRHEIETLRRTFIQVLEQNGIHYVVNGHPEKVLPHILNISFPGTETETLLMNLDLEGIACASGSACTSGTLEVSHVLKAMHLDKDLLRSALRFSFGMGNTVEDVKNAADKVSAIVRRLTKSETFQ